jgi:hypothetical protein
LRNEIVSIKIWKALILLLNNLSRSLRFYLRVEEVREDVRVDAWDFFLAHFYLGQTVIFVVLVNKGILMMFLEIIFVPNLR